LWSAEPQMMVYVLVTAFALAVGIRIWRRRFRRRDEEPAQSLTRAEIETARELEERLATNDEEPHLND